LQGASNIDPWTSTSTITANISGLLCPYSASGQIGCGLCAEKSRGKYISLPTSLSLKNKAVFH